MDVGQTKPRIAQATDADPLWYKDAIIYQIPHQVFYRLK